MSDSGIDWELILADDDSQDGSLEIVEELAGTLPVRMIVREDKPRDLSQSVLSAIGVASYDRIVVMDADLSHPPSRILDLANALDEDCGIAVGSRYTEGGGFEQGWGGPKTHKLTGGFFAGPTAHRLHGPDVGELRRKALNATRFGCLQTDRLQNRS